MLSHLTLADRYHTLNERLKELEAEVKAARELIIATGQETVTGDYADIKVSLSERTTFDNKLAQTFLTPEQIAACTRQTLVITLRAKAKVAA